MDCNKWWVLDFLLLFRANREFNVYPSIPQEGSATSEYMIPAALADINSLNATTSNGRLVKSSFGSLAIPS